MSKFDAAFSVCAVADGESGRSGGNSPNRRGKPPLKSLKMNIKNLLNSGNEMCAILSLADLKEFALTLIAEAKAAAKEEKEDEEYLTPQQTAEMLGVTTNSLWRWNRDGYLKNVKVGRKPFYKKSDVFKLMEG